MYYHPIDRDKIGLDEKFGRHKAKKWPCPQCGKKRFVRYYNFTQDFYYPEEYGKCDRQDNCKYWRKLDREYYYNNALSANTYPKRGFVRNYPTYSSENNSLQSMEDSFSTIELDVFLASFNTYENNIFVHCLKNTFGHKSTDRLVKNYFVGSAKLWKGATVFWRVDMKGRIRTGKIMLFKPDMHRTKKTNYVHSVLKLKNFTLKQCFFGEHLLKNASEDQIIAIVESEKTAIVASYFFPDYIWLATGGETMLNAEKCHVLQGRKVVFFPDLSTSARNRWKEISAEVNASFGLKSIVSPFKEDIDDGSDIADYLLALPIDKKFGNLLNEHGYPASWDDNQLELKKTLEGEPIQQKSINI